VTTKRGKGKSARPKQSGLRAPKDRSPTERDARHRSLINAITLLRASGAHDVAEDASEVLARYSSETDPLTRERILATVEWMIRSASGT
jgi:hypothetical protein